MVLKKTDCCWTEVLSTWWSLPQLPEGQQLSSENCQWGWQAASSSWRAGSRPGASCSPAPSCSWAAWTWSGWSSSTPSRDFLSGSCQLIAQSRGGQERSAGPTLSRMKQKGRNTLYICCFRVGRYRRSTSECRHATSPPPGFLLVQTLKAKATSDIFKMKYLLAWTKILKPPEIPSFFIKFNIQGQFWT